MSALQQPVPDLSQAEAVRLLGLLLVVLERGQLPLAVDSEKAAAMLNISAKTLHRLPIRSALLGHRTRRYAVKHLLEFLEAKAK